MPDRYLWHCHIAIRFHSPSAPSLLLPISLPAYYSSSPKRFPFPRRAVILSFCGPSIPFDHVLVSSSLSRIRSYFLLPSRLFYSLVPFKPSFADSTSRSLIPSAASRRLTLFVIFLRLFSPQHPHPGYFSTPSAWTPSCSSSLHTSFSFPHIPAATSPFRVQCHFPSSLLPVQGRSSPAFRSLASLTLSSRVWLEATLSVGWT